MIQADGTERKVIHLAVPVAFGLAPACSPWPQDMTAHDDRTFPLLRSEDPRAVTCLACRETDEWKKAFAAAPTIPGRNFLEVR